MFSLTKSATVFGIDGLPVDVETDAGAGLPGLEIVGMADTAVRESRQRVRAAIRNSGFDIPPRKIVVNLAPAGLHKEGTQMDLAIAVGILASCDYLPKGERLEKTALLGEVALDGTVRPVPGVLPMVAALLTSGVKEVIVPRENAAEVSFLRDMRVLGCNTLSEVANFLRGKTELRVLPENAKPGGNAVRYPDLSDIRGQLVAKRALEIAAAGAHSMLMSGPPGSGKSMLASALPGILPPLSVKESLEVTRIHSAAGVLPPGTGLVTVPPFRSPHHTTTLAAITGGGKIPRPGEITLAHRGVLFLDELPLFPQSVLNALREPLENGSITITRWGGNITFPSRFLLVSAMNPCPCGFYGSSIRECTCTEHQRKQYISKINGPILDRVDIYINVQRLDVGDLTSTSAAEPSSTVKERVALARERQLKRYEKLGLSTNSELGPTEIASFLTLSRAARKLLMDAYRRMHLSARVYYRVIKVAASIADLSDSPRVEDEHVAEALSYRQRVVE